jgi:chromate transporter
MASSSSTQLRELAGVFLRLGATAFGGPATLIAMMQDEAVTKRRWLSSEEFVDMLGAVNLLPGPASTKMAIFVGYRRAGMPGALLSGFCTTLPVTLMMLPLAWAYVRYGQLAHTAALFAGMRPVIVVIVIDAIWSLGRSALQSVMDPGALRGRL